jgi:hypothetical protein
MRNPYADPGFQKLIKRKRRIETKELVRALYRTDPIVWALIREGNCTHEQLEFRFPAWANRLDREIDKALNAGTVKLWGKTYRLVHTEHKNLRKRWLNHLNSH